MWALLNRTPYKVESTWGRDKEGVHEWIVAVKGTFDIKPDGCLKLANEQLDPLPLPEYNSEDGVSSLRYDADLVAASKPTTDVVLNGTSYAPKGHSINGFLVSLRVGRIRKVVRVAGNRRWKRGLFGLKPSAAEPITKIPIICKRTYCRYDQTDLNPKNQRLDFHNPVGCGACSNHLEGQTLPTFQYGKGSLKKAGPAGSGTIATHWSPLLALNSYQTRPWSFPSVAAREIN